MATVATTWRRLHSEQRIAGVASVLLMASTLGPFSFVEAAEILTALALLALLVLRSEGRRFHLPFGDGTAVLAAGVWSALLIVTRIFDRPAGQSVLALVCAALLILAGLRERARRDPDDLPEDAAPPVAGPPAAPSPPSPPAPPSEQV